MDNDSGTSDLKAPMFDMESEGSELDKNSAESRYSCVDECCLDDIFNSTGSDVSKEESPEFHHDDQRFDTTELNYKTMTCLIDVKGIVRSCVPKEQHIPNDEKIILLKYDIRQIYDRLRSFFFDQLDDYIFCIRRKDIIRLTDSIKKDMSKLDDFWNGHYLVTEELNRQFNELNHSNTGLCHMTQEVACLYSTYADTKFGFQGMLTFPIDELVPLNEEVLIQSYNYRNTLSDNKNVTSDSESIETNTESVTSDSESIESNTESVTSDSERRSEFRIDDDKFDGCESLFNTDIVNADVAVEETIVETHPHNNNVRFRRIKWIAVTHLIFMILWLGGWMDPQDHCDKQNDHKCSVRVRNAADVIFVIWKFFVPFPYKVFFYLVMFFFCA